MIVIVVVELMSDRVVRAERRRVLGIVVYRLSRREVRTILRVLNSLLGSVRLVQTEQTQLERELLNFTHFSLNLLNFEEKKNLFTLIFIIIIKIDTKYKAYDSFFAERH